MFHRKLFVNDDILNKLFNKEIKGDAVFLNEDFQDPTTVVYDEASFQSDSAAKQLKNIVSVLSKRAALPFYGGKFSLIIKKPHGKFKTVKYIIGGQGRQAIRFNLALTGGSANIYSIDFWNKVSKYPQMTIDVHGLNVVQLLDFIVDIIKHGKVGMKEEIFFHHGDVANQSKPAAINESIEAIFNESVMEDRAKLIKTWAGKNINTYAQMKVSNVYQKFASEKGGMDENQFRTSWRKVLIDGGFYAKQIVVQKGGTREEIIVNAPKSAEESLGKDITGRIPAKEKFQQIKEYIKLVADGVKKSFILTGDAGLGKSFTVKQTLNKLGADYKFYKGSIISAINLYQVLFENNSEGKIVVLDDCDDILKDKAGVNILKAALDTGEEVRTISYMSQRMPKGEDGERLPTEFDYVGKIIFISNEYLKDMPGPLKSRAFKSEINLTPTEIVDRISDIVFEIAELQKVPKPVINECLQYMEKIAPAIGKFDIRSFTDVVANRLTGHKNWKAWAYESIKQSYGLA